MIGSWVAGSSVGELSLLRAMKAPAVRVVATLPGKNTIGIEVPNTNKEKVRLKELMMLGGTKPTTNALKAMLQQSAFPMSNASGQIYDVLTQGAGSLNAAGAATAGYLARENVN